MEQLAQYIDDFSYPMAIIAAYVVIVLVKRYTDIETKYYLLVAVAVGIIVVILEEIFNDPITLKKLIAGALSGLIAEFGYETIDKIISSKSK